MKTAPLLLFITVVVLTTHSYVISETAETTLTKHFNESLFKIMEKGKFSVEILMDEKEYRIGENVIGIVIHDKRDRDVEGAEIKATVVTSEGIRPLLVKEKDDGLYTAEKPDFKREGRWELTIKIKKKGNEDEGYCPFL
ncbi:MAG: FixH family protein [Thermodesulfovibrionales bacterium]|nr:FixH family protein [Thermodesulfovibrionales bacterium]